MSQALDDLRFVRWLLQEGRFFDKGCFVAQQAAEKSLKALLYRGGARTVLGHSVLELVERAVGQFPDVEKLREAARLLDRFYIPTRYPNGLPGGAPFESFTASDLAQAVELAGRIVESIDKLLAAS
jgi:HEPN domain-containing protein